MWDFLWNIHPGVRLLARRECVHVISLSTSLGCSRELYWFAPVYTSPYQSIPVYTSLYSRRYCSKVPFPSSSTAPAIIQLSEFLFHFVWCLVFATQMDIK